MIPDLSDVPQRPGVYIFKGRGEKVLYVGKAKNLRNRLRSYFQESAALDQRKLAMVRQAMHRAPTASMKSISFLPTRW